MKVQMGGQTIDLRPFVWATGIWAAISAGILGLIAEDFPGALRTWAVFFFLAVTDLFFLVKTIAALLHLMSHQGAKNRSAYTIQAAVYGGLKLVCLGAIGFLVWKFPNASRSGIFLGLSAIIIVPLAGGFSWSQSQLKSE